MLLNLKVISAREKPMLPPRPPGVLWSPPMQTSEVTVNRAVSQCYSLRMEGHLMEPVFAEGTVLIVAPDSNAKAGDFVLAQLPGGHPAVRQLINCGGCFHLQTLNPHIPPVPLGEGQILGVIREAVRRLR